MDPIELLQALVATPSVSRDEAAVAERLGTWLMRQGLTVEYIGDNLIARVQGRLPGPLLLLNSHLDTVSAKDGWTRDPWSPTIEDGRLYGLGSNDAKASLTAMACAISQLAERGLERGGVVFAATVMEEVGGGGLEHIVDDLGPITAALVGEPTSLEAAVAQGGLMILEGTATGKAAHAARPWEGKNALDVAARDILAIHAVELDRVHPLLGRSVANVTVLRGGERHNVIPGACDYTIDVRYTPAYKPAEIAAILDEVTEAALRIRSQRLAPVETAADAPIVAALREAMPGLRLVGSPTMSDWAHLRHVEAVKIGPGDSARSHTPDEWVACADVHRAVDLYRDAALALLEGDDP